jgi:tRNA pseudouridine55 synthase
MDAVILIDKPKGLSSQETVTVVKKKLRARKAGHTGTLDPIATGLLPVCVGEATKISRFLLDLPKQYITKIRLGERTDTFDAEGEVTARGEIGHINKENFEDVLKGFRGKIRQTPPMYSALKREGRPLYELARKGIEVEREEREVEVYELELLALEPPFAELLITCAKGTYVRSLVDDIGTRAGTYAHIAELRRTRIGEMKVEDASLPDVLPYRPESVLTIDQVLSFMEEVRVDGVAYVKAKNGASFRAVEPVTGYVRIKGPDEKLFAIGHAYKGLVKIERGLHL